MASNKGDQRHRGIVRVMRVFVASPGDVTHDRDTLARVISELNMVLRSLVPEKGIQLELVRWETHVHPAMGRPQEVINSQIGDYDIFVGIMWKRFGSPTGVASSGTEEELNLAIRNWKEFNRPEIMFYFCQNMLSPPRSIEDAEQLLRVVKFRNDLSQQGLVGEYDQTSPFGDVIRSHLISLLARKLGTLTTSNIDETYLGPDELAITRRRVVELAEEYATVRRSLPSGHERTRRMEVILTRMRSEAPRAFFLLDELTRSDQPGQRLMAVALLQVTPHAAYTKWLGERFRGDTEVPFVQYHSAVALLCFARVLPCSDLPDIHAAIQVASRSLEHIPESADRRRMLNDADIEVQRRIAECNGRA